MVALQPPLSILAEALAWQFFSGVMGDSGIFDDSNCPIYQKGDNDDWKPGHAGTAIQSMARRRTTAAQNRCACARSDT